MCPFSHLLMCSFTHIVVCSCAHFLVCTFAHFRFFSCALSHSLMCSCASVLISWFAHFRICLFACLLIFPGAHVLIYSFSNLPSCSLSGFFIRQFLYLLICSFFPSLLCSYPHVVTCSVCRLPVPVLLLSWPGLSFYFGCSRCLCLGVCHFPLSRGLRTTYALQDVTTHIVNCQTSNPTPQCCLLLLLQSTRLSLRHILKAPVIPGYFISQRERCVDYNR